MSSGEVRPASADDVAAIFALARSRPYTAKWSAEDLAAEVARPEAIFLVFPGQGYALARVVETDCRLLDLAVASDGLGTGRALLSELTLAARTRGCVKVTLEVSSENARARTFYEKAGATVVGSRPKFYYDGSDAVLMDLNLR